MQRTHELNPNHVTGHYWYALFLAAMKRFDEAMAQIELASVLDPLSLVVKCNKAQVLYFARRYEEAIAQLLDSIEMDGEFPLARFILGTAYLQTGQFADAAQQFERARESTNGHPAATAGLAAALAHSKKKADGRKFLRELEKQAEKTQGIRYYLAIAWLSFGDTSRALRSLEKACDERSASIPNIEVEPALDPLRSNTGFKKVLNRVALKSR